MRDASKRDVGGAGQFHHSHAVVEAGVEIGELVRWILRRHEQHAIQCEGVGRLSRDGKMGVVDRIERAAKDGDPRRH